MKNTITVLQWAFAIVVAILVFLFFWQKQQNEHTEKMIDKAAEQAKQNRSEVIELGQEVENKSVREKVGDGIKSVIAFVLGIFSKM